MKRMKRMKRKELLCGIFVVLLLLCACKNKEEQNEIVTATPILTYQPFAGDISEYVYYYEDERNKDWEEDIIYLANIFVNRHPMLADIEFLTGIDWVRKSDLSGTKSAYNEESRRNFLQQINDLVLKVADLDDTEIIYELQKCVALLKDGHSKIMISGTDAVPIYYVPIMTEGEYRFYVCGAPKKQEQNMYSYLESVNGIPIEEIIARISQYVSADSEEWLFSQISNIKNGMAIMHKDSLISIGVMKKEDTSAELSFITEDGIKQNVFMEVEQGLKKEEMLLDMMELKSEVLMYQNKDSAYWYTKLEETDALYIKMNKCVIDETTPTKEFVEQIVEEIKVLPENATLILDFRNNTGGNAEFMNYRPMIDEINKREDISSYILINKNSYSSGVLLPYLLRQEIENANLVGEPAGQGPNIFGNPTDYYLPNSKHMFTIATNYIALDTDYAYNALLPDITIYQTLEDYKNGIDTVLEAVMAME